jgi:hypothetical protein
MPSQASIRVHLRLSIAAGRRVIVTANVNAQKSSKSLGSYDFFVESLLCDATRAYNALAYNHG